jgi:hypothetical protein
MDNRNAHIPSAVQVAMSHEVQQKLPPHLQKYVGNDKPTYIPQHAQAELTSYMQKNMPSHLQEYSGAYVQQNIVDPTLRGSYGTREAVAPPPTARVGQQSRSATVPGEQPNAQFFNLYQPDAAPGKSAQPMVLEPGQAPQQNTQQPQSSADSAPGANPNPVPGEPGHDPYDFIFNPQQPAKKTLLPRGNSMLQRIAIFGGGFVLLVIIIAIFASVLGSGGKTKSEDLITVAQDQTELIRVATDGAQNTTTLPMQNLAQDVLASITSDKTTLLTYMKGNGQKVSAKQLTLKHTSSTDTTLSTAKENSTYDSAFKDIIQSDLNAYQAAIQKAYNANPGPKGKALLTKQFDSAGLLLKLSKQ